MASVQQIQTAGGQRGSGGRCISHWSAHPYFCTQLCGARVKGAPKTIFQRCMFQFQRKIGRQELERRVFRFIAAPVNITLVVAIGSQMKQLNLYHQVKNIYLHLKNQCSIYMDSTQWPFKVHMPLDKLLQTYKKIKQNKTK